MTVRWLSGGDVGGDLSRCSADKHLVSQWVNHLMWLWGDTTRTHRSVTFTPMIKEEFNSSMSHLVLRWDRNSSKVTCGLALPPSSPLCLYVIPSRLSPPFNLPRCSKLFTELCANHRSLPLPDHPSSPASPFSFSPFVLPPRLLRSFIVAPPKADPFLSISGNEPHVSFS